MLLCVSLVWPTKFANTLSFYAKQIWCLRFYGKYLMISILGKLGLKLCFLKNITSHTHAFCSSISMLWGVSKMCLWFFQNCVFAQKFCEPLSASIDPICFSNNRNCFKIFKEASICFDQSKLIFDQSKLLNQVLKIRFWCVKLTFQKGFQTFFLSLRIRQG